MLIPLTDDRGKRLMPEDYYEEPLPGSLVLTNGAHGTGWQRHFADGLWHSTRGGKPVTWTTLIHKRGVLLAYDAPVRPEMVMEVAK